MGFSLLIREGHGAGETLRFDEPEVSFGRVADNDVVLHDPDVSRKHFTIVEGDGCHVLKDLGSSNGTYLNGERIDSDVLSAGDSIQVGRMVFEFQEQAASRNLPARRPRTSPSTPASAARSIQPSGGLSGSAGVEMTTRRGGRGAAGAMALSGGGSARDRFRVRKAASTPMGRFKLWHAGLPPQRRRILHIGAGVIGLLLVVGVFAVSGDEPVIGERDLSGMVVPFEFEARDWTFGYGAQGVTHQARSDLSFSFSYADGRVTVTFDAGFIDSENEVEIRLNDERLVGYAPIAIETWVPDIRITLPLDGLIENSMNTIVFDQVKNPGARPPATWGIRNLWISEEPLPAPDPRRAEERFALAERRWRNRSIGPGNLYEACRYYGEAKDYLERVEAKPPLYDEADARLRECNRELDQLYRRLTFQAQRYERFREWEKARGTLMMIMEHFPDETDYRNRSIQLWLQTYN